MIWGSSRPCCNAVCGIHDIDAILYNSAKNNNVGTYGCANLFYFNSSVAFVIPVVTHWCYTLMLHIDATHWCYTLMLHIDASHWCYTLMLHIDATQSYMMLHWLLCDGHRKAVSLSVPWYLDLVANKWFWTAVFMWQLLHFVLLVAKDQFLSKGFYIGHVTKKLPIACLWVSFSTDLSRRLHIDNTKFEMTDAVTEEAPMFVAAQSSVELHDQYNLPWSLSSYQCLICVMYGVDPVGSLWHLIGKTDYCWPWWIIKLPSRESVKTMLCRMFNKIAFQGTPQMAVD